MATKSRKPKKSKKPAATDDSVRLASRLFFGLMTVILILITTSAVLDDNGVLRIIGLKRYKKQLETKIASLQKNNEDLRAKIELLNDPAYIASLVQKKQEDQELLVTPEPTPKAPSAAPVKQKQMKAKNPPTPRAREIQEIISHHTDE